jgi:hypothetical protein
MIQGHIRNQRRSRQLSGKIAYKYRGYPCNIRPHHEMYYVAGQDGNGGGILEWCTDLDDAKDRLRIMRNFPQFKNLRIGCNAEDDVNRTQEYSDVMEIKPTAISRRQYALGLASCLQVINNSLKWKPMRQHSGNPAREAELKEVDELKQRWLREQIQGWRATMRKMRELYYSDRNELRETPEQARERREQAKRIAQ